MDGADLEGAACAPAEEEDDPGVHGKTCLNLYRTNIAIAMAGTTPRKMMSKLFDRVVRPRNKKQILIV